MTKLLLTSASALALAGLLALPARPAPAQETAPETLDQVPAGGTLTIAFNDDVSTLDPAIGYDWQNWSIIKSLFDGLMDYAPGTTDLVPDLAESYDISADGLTYTFHLRPGVKFSNGRALTSADVKYSLERTVDPGTQSPGAGFFDTIAGYAEVASGTTKQLSGIETPDDGTVVFHLTRADAPFLHKMALNFAHVVPREAVEAAGADFGHQPVGSGAFVLAEWTLGQRLVLERNPESWKEGVPKLDRIVFEVGQDPSVALLRLQNGEIDLLGDPIPSAQFVQVRDDPAAAGGRLLEGGQLHTGYVTINTRVEPFTDVRVRQAVNMAINKDRVVRIVNNRAVPASQPLPPLMPGYAADYPGYAYDPEGAKALLDEAGYPDGFPTTLYANNTDPNPRIAQAIQQDLAAVGIQADLQTLAQSAVIAAGGTEGEAPLVWSGGMAWIADFPDPSNFYGPILGCGGAVEGGWNWAWYCNEGLDARQAEADAIVDPARQDERIGAWRQIYLDVMKDAPWAPVFNEQRFVLRPDRVAGPDAIFTDPVHVPYQFDYIGVRDGA